MPIPVASRSFRAVVRTDHAASGLRARHGLALALLTLTLAACVDYRPRPIDPAASARQFAARRLDAPQLHAAVQAWWPDAPPWPPPVWDRGSLLAVALVQNPTLAVARAEVDEARAGEVGAAEMPNPELTLQSEYARHESDRWLYGLGLDFLLRTPARRHLDIDIARLAGATARWQVIEQIWTLRRTLVAALGDWQNAQRRGALLDGLVDGQQQLVAVQQQRVDAGEDAPGALAAVRTALLEAEQQRGQARADVVAAQAGVAAVLGVLPQALDGLRFEWPEWGAPPPLDATALRAAREHALLARADLAAAIGDYASAEKKLERAIARQYPEFHLQPGYYWDHGIAKWPLDLAFALPLFNRNQGEIAVARAAREVAGQRMLAVQVDILGRVEAALRAETVAAENVVETTRRVDAANEQVRQARLGIKLGAIDRSERIAAEAVALRAELDALQARARRQVARDALEDALQAPLSGPELALPPALERSAPGGAASSRPTVTSPLAPQAVPTSPAVRERDHRGGPAAGAFLPGGGREGAP